MQDKTYESLDFQRNKLKTFADVICHGLHFKVRGDCKFSSPFDFYKSSEIKVITKLPNSEQSYKGKVQTHNYINRQNQSTTGKL